MVRIRSYGLLRRLAAESSRQGVLPATLRAAPLALSSCGRAHGQKDAHSRSFPRAPGFMAAAGALLACAGWEREKLRCEDRAPSQGRRRGLQRLVLAADCGGTSTRLQMYRVDPDDPIEEKKMAPGVLIAEEKYPNIMYKSLEEIIGSFLRQYCTGTIPKPTVACLAVAGIVTNNACRFTNLDWIVDGEAFEKHLGFERVEIINDFVAQGYGMLTLGDDETTPLNDAHARRGAPIACIGAGTGLGTCFLVADPSGDYTCYPSEAGHVEFAPRGEGSEDLQVELLKFLKIRFSGWNRISVERVVSGKGICNIYEFLAYANPKRVDKVMHREFLQSGTDAGVVAKHAVEGSLCQEAMDIFAECYGAACGSMAIQFMPFRGLFITGGVSKKMQHIFDDSHGHFMSAYKDKGRVSTLLDQVPLYLVNSDDMGQRGAHLRAVRLLRDHLAGEGPRIEIDHDMVDKDHLVAPRSLVYGGEPEGDAMSAMYGESHIESYASRNRRLPIDPQAPLEFEPVFKTMLWRVPREGNALTRDDWMFREMWISRNGCLCYQARGTKEGLVYWTAEDLKTATIADVPSNETARPWSFSVQPFGFEPSIFAADSPEALALWKQQLKQLCKPDEAGTTSAK